MTGTQIFETPACKGEPSGRAVVPAEYATEGPLILQLQQVQVMFRHGARTPLHLIPKVPEAIYDPQFVTREHQASLFPYKRVSYWTQRPVDWSEYEKHMQQRPLRGGATAGTLTSYGKDEMYLLGQRLRTCYRERLDTPYYSNKDIFVISSNIRRTVESARCVLAGFYGGDQLREYAERCGPIIINVSDDDYNILIPDTHKCEVLKKVNHAAMLHPDFIPCMQDDRITLEEHIENQRQKQMDFVRKAQSKVDAQVCSDAQKCKKGEEAINRHHEPYLRDPDLQPLLDCRGEAIDKYDRFWSTAMSRHPELSSILTVDDMKALYYLRRLEVEEFDNYLQPGYRFHFYFDENPYFHNRHLCKEVYSKVASKYSKPSNSTKILWKEGGKEAIMSSPCRPKDAKKDKRPCISNRCECPKQCKCPDPCKCPKDCRCGAADSPCRTKCNPASFFMWFTKPTRAANDRLGCALKTDLWLNPFQNWECPSFPKDPWDQKTHFVFARDDAVARVEHGWAYPKMVEKYKKMITRNATTIMYYAMTGQHIAERGTVARLSAGPLMTEMVDQAEKMIAMESEAKKLCFYSSHDSTMTGLLEVLGIFDHKWPPYGSEIRIELYKDLNTAEHYVRILYNGKVKKIRRQTEDFMHWCDFRKAINSYIITQDEHKEVCASNVLERLAKDLLQHEEGEVTPTPDDETPAGM